MCCFEVNENFLIAYSHISSYRLIRRASVFHQHTKVRGVRRPTFTSTRLDTCLGLDDSFRKIVVPKKNGFGCIGLLATSPLSAKTDSQLKLPKSQLDEKPTRCWKQTLSRVKGQLRPSFFSANVTFHEPSSKRSHRDPTRINRLPALTCLATQMLLNTMKYCRVQAVAFQAELKQFR